MRLPAVSSAPLLFAALLAPVWLAGCSPTATYGTGEAPEMALFREMTGGLIGSGKKDPIKYEPRAPLVMPPSDDQLPPPSQIASAASPDWPVDPDAQHGAATAFAPTQPTNNPADLRRGGGQAEYRRLKPLQGVLPDRAQTDYNDTDTHNYDMARAKQQRQAFQKALADTQGFGSADQRRFLTDPPTAYRQPAATAPAEFKDINSGHSGGSWFGWLFHRGG